MARKRESTASVKKSLREPPPRKAVASHYLSTGLDVLNLALSGRVDGGIPTGSYIWWVGDSESGKSFAALTMLAEAAKDGWFVKHRLIYDNSENSSLPDTRKFFKDKLADRLEVRSSDTVEEFYYRLDDVMKKSKCVWIEDSVDALRATADDEKFEADKEAHDNGKAPKGAYGVAKARVNSNNASRALSRLRETESVLVLVSQVRDKLNTPFPMQTHSGGKALKHYAHVQLWTKVREELKVRAMGKEYAQGSLIEIAVRKNRGNGWHGKLNVPFYRSFGFDNLGASVRFLTDTGYWNKVKGEEKYAAKELGCSGTVEEIVGKLRKGGWQKDLRQLAQTVWDKIEAACAIQRDSPYE